MVAGAAQIGPAGTVEAWFESVGDLLGGGVTVMCASAARIASERAKVPLPCRRQIVASFSGFTSRVGPEFILVAATKRKIMRSLVFTVTAAAALWPAGLMTSSDVGAAPLPSATYFRSAADQLNMDEKVVCYGFGWRGWGVYPGWFRPACAGAYGAPAYVVPAPDYLAAPVYPAANRCWVRPGRDGRPGYWASC